MPVCVVATLSRGPVAFWTGPVGLDVDGFADDGVRDRAGRLAEGGLASAICPFGFLW
jgi:hypothetical protein